MVLTSTSPGNAGMAPDRAHKRLGEMFDRGTVRPDVTLSGHGIAVARGEVQGTAALAFATESEPSDGSVGVAGCVRIAEAVDTARRGHNPIVGIWPSGGVALAASVTGLAGIGPMFSAIRGAAGRIPQISVVLGPAASGAAYVPALTDVVVEIALRQRSVTGPRVGCYEAGAPDDWARQCERADVVVDNGSAAVAVARSLVDLLGRPGRLELDGMRDVDLRRPTEFDLALDVRALVDALLDCPGIELHPTWARQVVTVLGRFGGRTIGVVAIEPGRPNEHVDEAAVDKARRFTRLCDTFGLPLILVVNREGKGHGPGFVEAVKPSVTLVTRPAIDAACGEKPFGGQPSTAELAARAAGAAPTEGAVAEAHGRQRKGAEAWDSGRRRPADNAFVYRDRPGVAPELVLPVETRNRIALALARREPTYTRHPVIHCR